MMGRPLTGWLLAAFAAVMLVLAWSERFAPLAQTTFGIALGPSASEAVVLSVVPGSGAAKLGLAPGDLAEISRLSLSDRYRLMTGLSPVGTAVRVPIIHSGVRRIVRLQAENESSVYTSHHASGSRSFVAQLVFLASATLTLLIVAFIALRRPSFATAALVFYGAGSITTYAVVGLFSWIPNPWYGALAVFITAAFSELPLLALLLFIVRFPQPPATAAARLRMRVADGIFIIGALLYTLESIYEPLLFATWTAFDTWNQLIFGAIILVFAVLAYHDASGEERRRIGWVIAGFMLSAVAYTTFDLANTSLQSAGGAGLAVALASQALQCALPIALGYAILRHRVLDIGFALNRTVVYAVMTTLVVGVVSFADWLTSRLLSEQRLALAIEALVTISFGFALNWIHGRTERLIDRIVFRQRHIAEKRIEYRIDALGFAASASAVNDALAVDAPQILNLSSAAVFGRLSPSAPFRRNASSGWPDDAAVAVDADSILVRTLRSLERPIFLDDVAIAPAMFPDGAARPVLAVPIGAQHELVGFALYGNHRDGASPDPEEISLLARLTAAAGNAYGAVEARQWRERVSALEDSIRGMAATPLQGA